MKTLASALALSIRRAGAPIDSKSPRRPPASPEPARSDLREAKAEEVSATEGCCERSDTAATFSYSYEDEEEEEPEVSSSTPAVELIAEQGANTSALVESLVEHFDVPLGPVVVQEA